MAAEIEAAIRENAGLIAKVALAGEADSEAGSEAGTKTGMGPRPRARKPRPRSRAPTEGRLP